MANSRDSVGCAFGLDPQQAQRLRQACPDLDDWPRSWHVEPTDIVVGQQIVAVLTPFLLQLLDKRLAETTVSRHRNNLRTLGGELIRRRYDDEDPDNMNVKDALQQLIEADGGPLMWPRITESEQDSLDILRPGRATSS